MVSRGFWLALAVRFTTLLLPQTYFQPDEFYQALEPAHWLVFGFEHLTWEWKDLPRDVSVAQSWWEDHVVGGRMRSWLWPIVFAGGYKVLQSLNLDQTFLLVGHLGQETDRVHR
jgi:phosphatidylinositol glycan class B